MELANNASGALVLAILLGGTVLRSRFPSVPLWSIMMLCTSVTLLLNLVGLDEAMSYVDLDVIMLLIGMFSLVGMAERSGLLEFIAYSMISRFRSLSSLVMGSSVLFGLMAAFFVNDTVALMGPPIAVILGKAIGNYQLAFLLLCYSITVGSVMTPIGNPQNMLIALKSGIDSPFIEFMLRLSIPTLISLVLVGWIMMRAYRLTNRPVAIALSPWESVSSRREFVMVSIGGLLTFMALIVNDLLAALGYPHIESRGLIPFVAAAMIWPFTRSPREVLARVDFGTILFFIGMFVTVEGIWRSGILTPLFSLIHAQDVTTPVGLFYLSFVSFIMSQLVSNVPYANLAVQQLTSLGVSSGDVQVWLTLAVTSTLAGNLTIIGAASNVIVLEVLESRYGASLSYVKFLKLGSVVTLCSFVVYVPFLLI
ncbi:MAG: SLC13 family permease [Aigarchaeota archaeon]|nr:SLC13 family permease [Aigarchaeota archaeon]MDW8093099.1 SLC13 family permease [Nitrososphaerota archaeon]